PPGYKSAGNDVLRRIGLNMPHARVRSGLDVLVAEGFTRLRGQRVGLVIHPASVDHRLRHALDLFAAADGVTLAAVFGPEHGLLGEAQDLVGIRAEGGPLPGVRAYSLYGETAASLRPTTDQLDGIDA